MKKKLSNKRIFKALIIGAFLIALPALFAACQETPEKNAVVSKTNITELLENGSNAPTLLAPQSQKWVETFSVGKTEVQVDADYEKIPMKSLPEIQERFRQHMELEWAYDTDSAIKSSTLKIERVTLGMMRTILKDGDGSHVMLPVWDFFGSLKEVYPDGILASGRTSIKSELSTSSFLTINAVDGSIVNRNLGY